MLKKFLLFTLTFTLILLVSTFGVYALGDSIDTDEEYSIEIYTFQNGTSTYVMGVALADLINENSEWLRATALESPGPSQTAMMLIKEPEKRKSAIGYFINQDVVLGYPPFEEPYYDLRAFASYGLVMNSFMTNRSDIESLQDVSGKRIGIGTKPNMPRVDIPLLTLEKMGIKNVKPQYLNFKAGADALLDRKIAALLGGGFAVTPDGKEWTPNPVLAEILARDDVKYLSYDKKKFNAAREELGHNLLPGVLTIPPYALGDDQTEPLTTAADFLAWGCHKDMPDKVVKEIVKIMAENAEQFKAYVPTGEYVTPETMAMLPMPDYIHPAAKEYYEENRIRVPSREYFKEHGMN